MAHPEARRGVCLWVLFVAPGHVACERSQTEERPRWAGRGIRHRCRTRPEKCQELTRESCFKKQMRVDIRSDAASLIVQKSCMIQTLLLKENEGIATRSPFGEGTAQIIVSPCGSHNTCVSPLMLTWRSTELGCMLEVKGPSRRPSNPVTSDCSSPEP
jgi:hypothetical protein